MSTDMDAASDPIPVRYGHPLPAGRDSPCVIVVGVFDGVHVGHRALLTRARAIADERGLPLSCVTFDPHPMSVVMPDRAPLMLASMRHRIRLLAETGVDAVRVLTFDEALSHVSAEGFVRDYLVADLDATVIAVGENFRFGHRATGDVALMRALGPELGYDVVPIGLAGTDGEPWSSTRIRRLISATDVEHAAIGLTRPHRVEGPVVVGDRRGRQLGYPTANVSVPHEACRPGDGVYAAWLVVDPYGDEPHRMPAAVSVGANTTFDGKDSRVEAYVIEPGDHQLYDRHVAVDFVRHLRPMITFESVDGLLAAMAADVVAAEEILADH